MKIAVSIPDRMFEKAERFARQKKKSRSALYRLALAEYLARHTPEQVTEAMDRVCTELEEGQDMFVASAAHLVLKRIEW